eukprot:7048675-Pyramimonas_sp.AAC.1
MTGASDLQVSEAVISSPRGEVGGLTARESGGPSATGSKSSEVSSMSPCLIASLGSIAIADAADADGDELEEKDPRGLEGGI